MIEMRKLQKLGKVELLELVQELTMELDELQARLDQQPAASSAPVNSQPQPSFTQEPEAVPVQQPQVQAQAAPQRPQPTATPSQQGQPGYFARSAQEIFNIAQRTQQEMDAYMNRMRASAKQREEEAQEIAATALGKANEIMQSLQAYQKESEDTIGKMMQSVTALQDAMNEQIAIAHSEYGQICHLIEQTSFNRQTELN